MKVFRKKCRAKDRKEVGTSNNAINMNYRKAVTITLEFRTYNPHTSFIIWFTPNWNKPMYKCTWVMLVMKKKQKEQKYPPNKHPTHPWEFCISLNKHSIKPWVLFMPI